MKRTTEVDESRRTTRSRQSQQQPSEDKKMPTSLTPHTLRLLKLVLEGTAEHAEEASFHLKRIAATSSPTQLWEILGRLQEGLTSTTWKTRTQAADALQGVSQQLPITDQIDFMQSTFRDPNAYHYLCLDELLLNSTFEKVLEEGQALYSTSFERYDYTQEPISKINESEPEANARNDSVKKRITLQRQIMAERLGLAKITEIIGGSSGIPLEDVKAYYAENQSTIDQEHAAKRRKVPVGRYDESSSICDLLVSEIKNTMESTEANVSHRNPQELLASELVFRMFDSAWYRRHGALLGLLSLIRAWRKAYTSESGTFGLWLRDVLSRALCVLALDRFGDFAGAMIANSEYRTGGVVAPVRELAGQLISLLFQLAPANEKSKILEALEKLAQYESCWEPRQGALACLKYILVVISSSETALDQFSRDLPEKICGIAIKLLNDDSDDVKGSAAQLILEYMRGKHKFTLDLSEAFRAIVRSVKAASDISSSLVDLMELLAELLEDNALSFVERLSNSTSTMENLNEIAKMLGVRLDSEFDSVRIAALRAVQALSGVYKAHFLASSGTFVITPDDLKVFCQLIQRIFNMFTTNKVSAETDDRVGCVMQKEHKATWELLSGVCRLLKTRWSPFFEKLENDLLCCYYWHSWTRVGHCEAVSPLWLHDALSTFVVSTESDTSVSKIEGIIRMFLRAPWIYNFEASCLLYRSLCAKSTAFSRTEINELLFHLLSEKPPNCLYVCQNAVLQEVTLGQSFLSVCTVAFEEELASSNQTQYTKIGERFEMIWASELLKRGYEIPRAFVKVPSLFTMRVETSIAGALVVASFPAKLTPVIRSLMTSLMNGSQSGDRISLLTSDFLTLLKKMASSEHTTPHTKVVNKLCQIAASQDESRRTSSSQIARRVLRSYVGCIDSTEALLRNPLWPNIVSLNCRGDIQAKKRALSLLEIVCDGLLPGSPLIIFLIETFAHSLTEEVCIDNDDYEDMRKVASSILLTLCKLDTTSLLKGVLRLLLPQLSLHSDESRLLLVTNILKTIIQGCSTDICKFVRVLLPSVMQLMCNTSQACSQLASSIFSNLVLNAPFAQTATTVSFHECGLEPVCENVIDHLIFGLPIPNCELPAFVTDELSRNSIVLRDYQKEGIAWLRFLQSIRLHGALCDSMGLGKSLQALVAVALAHYDHREQENARSLIVCPSSVVGHWVNEIRKFFPLGNVFSPVLYSGSPAARRALRLNNFSGGNIVVTSYSMLRSDTDTFCQTDWIYCVLDEGHLLKDPKTATAIASKKLRAKHRIILTGTLVQNNVNEVWAIFDFLMPNYLGSSASFTKNFARPIMKSQLATASTVDVQDGSTKLKLLHQQTLPFILRREKDRVLRELPPKIITIYNVPLSPVQKQLYAEFCSTSDAQASLDSFKKMLLSDTLDTLEPSKLGSGVLKTILFLRLLCSHPTLVLPEQNRTSDRVLSWYSIEASGKLTAVQYLLSEAGIVSEHAMGADGDYSALYTDFSDEVLEDPASNIAINADFVDLADNRCEAEHYSETKCLIFAQFTRTLDVVEELLFKRKFPSLRYSRIDGKVPPENRAALAEKFNNDKSISVMLLTTRIGSLGLNLTGANMVIILESDFNPFADLQAIDRAHRIGQHDAVRVYKLITKDSIEESIQLIQEKKVKISDAIVNAENSTMLQMGTEKLLDLFSAKSNEAVGRELEHIDLDALLAAYSEEYTSLSAHSFTQSLQTSSVHHSPSGGLNR